MCDGAIKQRSQTHVEASVLTCSLLQGNDELRAMCYHTLSCCGSFMAWSYKIDKERRLVITTAWNTLTGDQVLEHQRQLRSDPSFNPEFFQFLDFTRATRIDIDLPTVIELADIDLFSGKSRRAFFAGPNLLAYGMCRMFIAFRKASGEEQTRAFTDRDAALQWLGVAPFD
jgi:hypothetical protein